METRTYKAYKFDELAGELQDLAIDNLRYINVDFDWWDTIYDDLEHQFKDCILAKQFPFINSVKIKGFRLDRNRHAQIEVDIDDVALVEACFKEHKHIKLLKILIENDYFGFNYGYYNSYGQNTTPRIDKLLDELSEFRETEVDDLAEAIAIQLQNEYEYLTSDEAIRETIEWNNYYFKEDGSLTF